LDVLRVAVEQEVEAHDRGDQDTQVLDALVSGVRVGLARLSELERELSWRREEMRGAAEEARRTAARMLLGRTGAGRRVLRWHEGGWHEGAEGEGEAGS